MDEWDNVGLIGSVCDLALAELVVEAANDFESPEEVSQILSTSNSPGIS